MRLAGHGTLRRVLMHDFRKWSTLHQCILILAWGLYFELISVFRAKLCLCLWHSFMWVKMPWIRLFLRILFENSRYVSPLVKVDSLFRRDWECTSSGGSNNKDLKQRYGRLLSPGGGSALVLLFVYPWLRVRIEVELSLDHPLLGYHGLVKYCVACVWYR